jgi:rhodanese-related sulfurtransferase
MSTMTDTTSSKTNPTIEKIQPDTVDQWLKRGEAVLIDVREHDEHAREHITAAILVPLSSLDADAITTAKGDASRIVLHCNSGTRSMEAAARLAEAGHDKIYSLEGGIEAWRARGLPTKVNRKAPLPIMRQVQIAAGSLVLIGTLLGVFASQWWLILSGFVGAGLVFAGVSGFCGMANMLAIMPWNRSNATKCSK